MNRVRPIVVLMTACALLAASQARAESEKTAVLWPAGDIKWADNPAMKGAKIAVLWGDPKTGAYGALKTIPAGGKLAKHTHTAEQKVICLTGTIVLTMEGGSPKELGVGSYAFIPGGMVHTAECKAGADCTYFEEQPAASDIKFVEGTATAPTK